MTNWVLLKDWIEIKVSGPETIEYLNGIITKDLLKIQQGEIVRSAFLTPQAKVRSVYWMKYEDDEVFLYCPSHMKQALVEDLLKYKLSMDVKLEDITEETPDLYLVSDFEERIPGLSNENISFGFVHSSSPLNGIELKYNEFLKTLIEQGITPTEVMSGQNPYELGIEDVITLDKGCFLGQEPISRMYHRGNPRKFVYQLEFQNSPEYGKIVNVNNDDVGEILITSNNKGLAYLRRNLEDLNNLRIGEQSVKVLQKIGNYPKNDRA